MNIKKIAILTSGGDAPGMNAAIRAIVRSAVYYDIIPVGVKRGYKGLLDGDFMEMDSRSVGNIIQRGGTILLTSRCPEFRNAENQERALGILRDEQIDGLIVIGGDGTMAGAQALDKLGFPVIGMPATIDNDISGTEQSIGTDTCLNTIVEAVDKLRDTALSHERIFAIEIMGNESGYLAIRAALACGAESIIIPEQKWSVTDIIERINRSYTSGKRSHIIMVSEGAATAQQVADAIIEETGYEVRVTVLGHVQRGGTPSVQDRFLASRLGYAAVEALLKGERGLMVGVRGQEIIKTSFKEMKKERLDTEEIRIIIEEILSI